MVQRQADTSAACKARGCICSIYGPAEAVPWLQSRRLQRLSNSTHEADEGVQLPFLGLMDQINKYAGANSIFILFEIRAAV
jgi:hypothetical protein